MDIFGKKKPVEQPPIPQKEEKLLYLDKQVALDKDVMGVTMYVARQTYENPLCFGISQPYLTNYAAEGYLTVMRKDIFLEEDPQEMALITWFSTTVGAELIAAALFSEERFKEFIDGLNTGAQRLMTALEDIAANHGLTVQEISDQHGEQLKMHEGDYAFFMYAQFMLLVQSARLAIMRHTYEGWYEV